jgi:glycosyltransferase
MMKISIITASLNNAGTLEDCLKSIYSQSYNDIEHIVIDGGSTDGTLEIIDRYRDNIDELVSEPDDGIYHALNKGLKIASGDVVGFLHADDFYPDERVIEDVASSFGKYNVDSCYGDLEYVSKVYTGRTVRYWKSCPYREGLLTKGWMPPHPTLFVKRHVYECNGYFNTDFKIAADYEMILRLFERHRISSRYIPRVLVKMRLGGESNRSLKNMIIKSSEDYRAWKINNLHGSVSTIVRKNLSKIPQFFIRGNYRGRRASSTLTKPS